VQCTEIHTADLLCVTGDTQIELFRDEPRVRGCRVLVHEITAWDERRTVAETRAWGHTHVDEIIACAAEFEGDALVLVHRSPRHTRGQAEDVVRDRFPASIRDKVHVFGR
jgi:ribonuclease Z